MHSKKTAMFLYETSGKKSAPILAPDLKPNKITKFPIATYTTFGEANYFKAPGTAWKPDRFKGENLPLLIAKPTTCPKTLVDGRKKTGKSFIAYGENSTELLDYLYDGPSFSEAVLPVPNMAQISSESIAPQNRKQLRGNFRNKPGPGNTNPAEKTRKRMRSQQDDEDPEEEDQGLPVKKFKLANGVSTAAPSSYAGNKQADSYGARKSARLRAATSQTESPQYGNMDVDEGPVIFFDEPVVEDYENDPDYEPSLDDLSAEEIQQLCGYEYPPGEDCFGSFTLDQECYVENDLSFTCVDSAPEHG
eukprot:Phypoly_transcript_06246.p2 GENE.Phypoly_transcript_06246~~Phypoly_transcript_06246.p2  ORF type:complete len:305 (+),score=48.52 Phypoly_transcript_06246:894-1808(+)